MFIEAEWFQVGYVGHLENLSLLGFRVSTRLSPPTLPTAFVVSGDVKVDFKNHHAVDLLLVMLRRF